MKRKLTIALLAMTLPLTAACELIFNNMGVPVGFRIINLTGQDIEVGFYFTGDSLLNADQVRTQGDVVQRTIAAGSETTIMRQCSDSMSVMVGLAEVINTQYSTSTGLYRQGTNFDCTDAPSFTFKFDNPNDPTDMSAPFVVEFSKN